MKITSSMAFRLDDITPDMDWDKFYRVKAIFNKYDVKPLIGVVPDNRDPELKKGQLRPDFWEVVKSLKKSGWSVAMHGTRHIYETKHSGMFGLKKASEFAGLPYRVQYDKLEEGMEILKKNGITTDIFMAPGHTFDKKTLKALKKLGFNYVSDGYMDVPCRYKGLTFIPCRRSEPGLSTGMDTICLHPNELEEGDYRELTNFLEKHKNKVISFNDAITQLWYPPKGPVLFFGEQLNLIREKTKRRLVKSERLKQYIADTYDPDPQKKMKKRIKGLPGYLLSNKHRDFH